MKVSKNNQSGFGLILLAVAVVVFACVAFAGSKVYDHYKTKKTVVSDVVSTSKLESVKSLSNKADIKNALKITQSADLDSDLNTSALNVDINALQ